jgi:hypothetical protein
MVKRSVVSMVCLAALSIGAGGLAQAQSAAEMTFFVTSAGSGKGADFGGLAGADKHCQTLAAAVGAGNKTWRAYLSTQGAGAVNARDRIGKGPWQNAKGVVVARNVDELNMGSNINRETGLTEKGDRVLARIDNPPGPNQHDILTGTRPDGTAFPEGEDRTCGNWTKSGEGSAMVGHHDRMGLDASPNMHSWNSSHPSAGCSDPALVKTGGAGKIYCFAAN